MATKRKGTSKKAPREAADPGRRDIVKWLALLLMVYKTVRDEQWHREESRKAPTVVRVKVADDLKLRDVVATAHVTGVLQ